jgi:hypothetical protein
LHLVTLSNIRSVSELVEDVNVIHKRFPIRQAC